MKYTFAYTAGYIDGDGCFYVGKSTNKKTGQIKYDARLIIISTNRFILDFFMSIYGGSITSRPPRKTKLGHFQKVQYHFSISGNKALTMTESVMPYLVEKTLQAQVFMRYLNTTCKQEKDSLIYEMRQLKHELHFVAKEHKELFIKAANTIVPTEHDYAYLSGFIDAECHLGILHYKPKDRPNMTFKLILQCNNTKKMIFQYLAERFGGSFYFINRSSKTFNNHDQYGWRVTCQRLTHVLHRIMPHLKYKKPVCELMIEFDSLTIKNGGDRQSAAFKQSYASILQSKLDIVNKIHLLNLKGINT